ncbi:MAG: biotin--[acetyl-CoA-carboxylase] ligase [Cyclobacteriaceae bacterium]
MVYKILASTLFMGKNLVYVPECHSTNSLAADLLDRHTAPEGTLVITDRQTKGRGQRGNTWTTEARSNFTLSLILKPTFLKADQQFFLNMSVSLGIRQYLGQYVGGNASIKWPNDIMIGDKKVCGVLIENGLQGGQLATSIVGIGLNVNQQHFEYPNATSLSLQTGTRYNLAAELELLISRIESYYLLLRQQKFNDLEQQYLDHLFRKSELRAFKVAGQTCQGRIQGVDQAGHLLIEIDGVMRKFGFKEIEYV